MPSTSEHDEDPFLLTAPLEIRSILRTVRRHAALVRMYVKGNPDLSIMTTVLAFDEETGRVIVDCSPDNDLNQRLLKADHVIFDTQIDRININFTASGLQACTHDNLPALSFPLPPAIRRVQRREFYRVDIPMGEPASCTIPIVEPGKAPRRAVVRMKDISAGGVALLDPENQLPHESGVTLNDVRITLPEVGEVTVDLVVLRVHTVVLPNKKEIIELACKFGEISNASLMLIQGYIGRLERRLNAKRRGF
jgi:c-di-GMP-binding flagellar brake protein YcgR